LASPQQDCPKHVLNVAKLVENDWEKCYLLHMDAGSVDVARFYIGAKIS
jgi:hypothetical protein